MKFQYLGSVDDLEKGRERFNAVADVAEMLVNVTKLMFIFDANVNMVDIWEGKLDQKEFDRFYKERCDEMHSDNAFEIHESTEEELIAYKNVCRTIA